MRTLNIDECAEFLKIHSVTASEMAQRGELPGAKIGRSWVFLEDDLVDYLRAEVRRQQKERQAEHAAPESGSKPDLAKVDVIAAYPAIRQKRKSRRNIPPPLPKLPPKA